MRRWWSPPARRVLVECRQRDPRPRPTRPHRRDLDRVVDGRAGYPAGSPGVMRPVVVDVKPTEHADPRIDRDHILGDPRPGLLPRHLRSLARPEHPAAGPAALRVVTGLDHLDASRSSASDPNAGAGRGPHLASSGIGRSGQGLAIKLLASERRRGLAKLELEVAGCRPACPGSDEEDSQRRMHVEHLVEAAKYAVRAAGYTAAQIDGRRGA